VFSSATAGRQISLLAICQALLYVNNVTLISINGLAGLALSPTPLYATLPITAYIVGSALTTVPASLAMARDLNALVRGPSEAAALGVNVARTSLALHGLAALATAAAVTTAGSIGFVGLVVPHAMRLVLGNDQRLLLPAAAIAGGALLVVADTAARTLVAPLELPVGVLTALLGVPAFLYLLGQR